MEAFRFLELDLLLEFYIYVFTFWYFGLKAAGSNRGWTAGRISCFAGVRPSVLVLVAKKVLVVRRVGGEKAAEACLSVSQSLGLSFGRESVFPKRLLAAAGEGNFVPNS